ncbi:MAG: hypothetical protein JNN18_05185 [Rubrivivax sp.]|nr:hypothetical protein [Rubrivivax sp.]
MPDLPDFGFEPPPFSAENALTQLKRSLRDLRLAERGNAFELRGKRVVELQAEAGAIAVRLARKLALTPEWDRSVVKSAAEQRKLVDEVKKRLERWEREE